MEKAMEQTQRSYLVDLKFEVITLPPVSDILVLGKKTPQGGQGILHSFELILPDVFELIQLDEPEFPAIEAVIINKSILAKMPQAEILEILRKNVFPYVSKGETIKVDFNVQIFLKHITGEIVHENR
jgi:hypothetical protein